MIDLSPLDRAPRVLVEAPLRPVMSERFQPTGFPDLGAAEYQLHDGTTMLLVESAQSMANRMESVCWDEAKGAPIPELDGLPYVHVDIATKGAPLATASVLEAHRINSPYVLKATHGGETFEEVFLREVGHDSAQPVERRRFLAALMKYDPGTLLHGVFMSGVGDGRMRLARCVSAFVEARDVVAAQSGGVKNDRINASGETKDGFGNVPFARTEYTAGSITGFFNLDLRQLRAFGLPPSATRLLTLLALYKVARLVEDGMRLRTACDLVTSGAPRVSGPEGFALPAAAALADDLKDAIARCRAEKLFADPAVTRVSFAPNASSTKASRAKGKKEKDEAST
ncbi:MAG: type I-U CRISPR-associated RAMP protein Csb1/Cas7u [Polyangiales bacterium]